MEKIKKSYPKEICINSIHDNFLLEILNLGTGKWIQNTSDYVPCTNGQTLNKSFNNGNITVTFKNNVSTASSISAHFSAQEIFMLLYILHRYLENDNSEIVELSLSDIHKNIRGLNFNRNYQLDKTTEIAYVSALKRLKNRKIHLTYFSQKQNWNFSESLLQEIAPNKYYLGNFGKFIKSRKHFSNAILPLKFYQYDFKQIRKLCIALELGRCIFFLKKRGGYYFELNLATLMKKVPKYNKDGQYSGLNYFDMMKIPNQKDKSKYAQLFHNDVISVLNDLIDFQSVTKYELNGDIKINKNNFQKVKFVVYLQRYS